MSTRFSPVLCEQLQFLKPLITDEVRKLSPEELCDTYKTANIINDKRTQNACIAAMFNKMFGQINSIFMTDKYCAPNLSDEDKASETLDCIAEIMSLFDTSKNIKFITFFTTCLHRKMYAVSKPYKYKCRYITNEMLVSYEGSLSRREDSDGDQCEIFANVLYDEKDNDFVSTLEIQSIVDYIPFTDTQLKIANVFMSDVKSTNKDVAKTLHMTTSQVTGELHKMRRLCLKHGINGVF